MDDIHPILTQGWISARFPAQIGSKGGQERRALSLSLSLRRQVSGAVSLERRTAKWRRAVDNDGDDSVDLGERGAALGK